MSKKKNHLSEWEHALNLEELHELEECYPMVLHERNLVRKWVYSGHSVSQNPWHYKDPDGYELNYIEGYHQYLADKWGPFYRPFHTVRFDQEVLNEEYIYGLYT